MGKSQADLLRLPQVTKFRAAEFQPEGATDKTSQEAQNSNQHPEKILECLYPAWGCGGLCCDLQGWRRS